MSKRSVVYERVIEVPDEESRATRAARVAVRIAAVTLQLHDKRTSKHRLLPVNVVWVCEVDRRRTRSSRSGKTRSRAIDWMLLTNRPVATQSDAESVILGYTYRWRIEEFHRAWKAGGCNVEDSQLRRQSHVIKWATVLAAVAIRAERLKYLSRSDPSRPARDLLTDVEIRALVLLKRRHAKKTETIEDPPNIEIATRWIAELGGYTGKSSGGPPGTVTIGRGLATVEIAAAVLAELAQRTRSDE